MSPISDNPDTGLRTTILYLFTVEVTFKFFKEGLLYFFHENDYVTVAKVQLEVDGAHGFTDEVNLDIEHIVPSPKAACNVSGLVDGEDSLNIAAHAKADADVLYALSLIALNKLDIALSVAVGSRRQMHRKLFKSRRILIKFISAVKPSAGTSGPVGAIPKYL